MTRDVYSNYAIRRAAWQFLSGKAASALLTFIILLYLVRMLSVFDYGAYVVFIAGTEIGIALAGLGLPWLGARYIPEYRLRASGSDLGRLCLQLMLCQALALIALVAIVAFAMDIYLSWADLLAHRRASWFALALLLTEGLGRFVREGLMAPLILQGQARVSLVLRQSLFLTTIVAFSFAGSTELIWVLAAEVGASLAGYLVSVISFVWHLRSLRGQVGESGWQEPRVTNQWRIALRMYVAQLISLTYSPQVLINIVQRALGAESAAVFGFLRTLYEQVARYLPATLLFTVIRPKLMAIHLQGGVSGLTRQVNLVGKVSLFVLMPIVMIVALGGDGMVSLLSGGKFMGEGLLLLGLLIALVPCSQRQLLETVAVVTGRAGLCTFASVFGLLALPFMIYLLDQGFGLWAPVLAILFGQITLNATMLLGLKQIGYQADWRGATKLAASAIFAGLVSVGVPSIERNVIWLGLGCLLATLLFLALVWWLQAFTLEERQRFDGLIGRQLFTR
ncbi:MAG: hypothetical protein KUA37_18125 [Desulfomicrobium sp.]|nr:hypothetical protein [Pseudomonadota bacterium]MBU4572435.1 hypothetical protein [Pseudomonadota bacterium]MBV1713900.1 hypothetical protein [Desulfomicrobium sp.]MBV1719582.1 hypothetical protein [Desulfomicrobium sp.]MBV1748317.1 hypothetical protein [Desulfomicrobium sp.]